MKPLSPLLYSKRNKKKIFASINAVSIAVCFIYIMYTFVQSLTYMAERNAIFPYKHTAAVTCNEQKPIDDSVIKDIADNENTDRIVPTVFKYGIRYSIPGILDGARAVPLRARDVDYFMKKMDIKLIEGDLPKEGAKEIALNKDIAKNRSIKIGDKVGDSINKYDSLPGEYKVVGIVECDSLLSVLSANEEIFPNYKNEEAILKNGFCIFPKEGKKAELDTYIKSLPKSKVNISTESTVTSDFEKVLGVLKVIDVISILSIVVMVVTVGSSKYAQYINRKEELGVLNAIGYNKRQILVRTFKEVVLVNLLGFISGNIWGVAVSLFLDKGMWEPLGAKGFLFSAKGFVVAVLIPLFTILFSIVPINNLINKLDPIKMIEKN